MSKIGEMLANIGLGAAGETVNVLIRDLLENVKNNNTNDPALVVDAVKGFNSALNLLARAADKSKTQVDDKAIELLHKPVREFAADNDINLGD